MPIGLQGSPSVLMRVTNSAMTRGLHTFDSPKADYGRSSLYRFPGASAPLHRSLLVYMDDLLCYSPTLEQHIKDVEKS